MSKIINLRTRRKQAVRDQARAQGDANAAKFGLSKSQKSAAQDTLSRTEKHLDAHKLDGRPKGVDPQN